MMQQKRITRSYIKADTTTERREAAVSAARLGRIEDEFRKAFEFLDSLPKNVSFFGSSQTPPGSLYYEKARTLAARLVTQHNLGIVTGGGPGIMEAANRGALESGGVSAGLTIDLTHIEASNAFTNTRLDFHYFFARKVALSYTASMYIFFPGGFGTLDEFFELITLIQTRKIKRLPVICFGASYWEPLGRFMEYYMHRSDGYIQKSDLQLYTITDDLELVLRLARDLPDRE